MLISIDSDVRNTRRYFTSTESNYCYIPILKNASIFGLNLFQKQLGFSEVENINSPKKFIVFLRDPIKRWYSGVAQYFAMNVDNEGNFIHNSNLNLSRDDVGNVSRANYYLDEKTLKLVFDAVRLDDHADLQIFNLLGLDTDDCFFFNIDDDHFNSRIFDFVRNIMKVTLPKSFKVIENHSIKFNDTSKSSFKKNIKNQLLNAVKNNDEILKNVYHYYYYDTELLNTVNYYTPASWTNK